MSGLILELQADALDRNVRVSDLLRKAFVISKKLGINELERWIQNELNGYSPHEEIPAYREIRGEIKVWNPYRGWLPLNFSDHTHGEALSNRTIWQPVSELDELKESGKERGLHVPFSQQITNTLMHNMAVPLQPSLHVPYTEIVGILDTVRNNLLQWALELEQKGVIGEGMTFSKEEKSAATQVTYQITNNIGSMSHSQLQQHSSGASQVINQAFDLATLTSLVKALHSALAEISLEASTRDEYVAELRTLESQAASPKPKLSILSESLKSVRTILEGTAGNVLAGDLLQKINALLLSLS
jgi:hypothetical protein